MCESIKNKLKMTFFHQQYYLLYLYSKFYECEEKNLFIVTEELG